MAGWHKGEGGREEKQTKPRGMCNFPGSAPLGLDEKNRKIADSRAGYAVVDIYIYIKGK